MKLLALAAAAASLIVATSLGTTASARSHDSSASGFHRFSMLVHIPTMHSVVTRRASMPLQAGGATPTPTATATVGPSATAQPSATAPASPTAQPSPTLSPYPDPVTLLNNSIALYERITKVHFEDIIIGDQTNIEHLSIDAKGTANCTSELATVKGADSVPGTAEKKTVHYEFIQKGKKFYKKQLVNDSTHKTWRSTKAKNVEPFGFSIDNPLACPSSSGSTGGSGGSDTLTPPVNQGPVTYHGIKTWHVTTTDVSTDAQGATTETALDFYIGQTQSLPYGYKATIDDPANNVTLSFEQVLTQFGKKVSIPTPKIGSTTP